MILALTLLLLCLPLLSHAEDLPGATFVSAYDGDTVMVNVVNLPRVFGYHLRVRLTGIDAPELKGQCPKESALALVARDFLASTMSKAVQMSLLHVTRDKYFRVDSQVLADGVNLNQEMVKQGYAVLYTGQGPRKDWCAP